MAHLFQCFQILSKTHLFEGQRQMRDTACMEYKIQHTSEYNNNEREADSQLEGPNSI